MVEVKFEKENNRAAAFDEGDLIRKSKLVTVPLRQKLVM